MHGSRWASRLATLFFVLLLSLLIALFDRFRGTRDPVADRQTVWPAFRAGIEQRRHRSTVAAKLTTERHCSAPRSGHGEPAPSGTRCKTARGECR